MAFRPVKQHLSEQNQNKYLDSWKQSMSDIAISANEVNGDVDDEQGEVEPQAFPENMLGVLSIEKIDFEMPVLSGTASETLLVAAGVIEYTPLPKEQSNFCLAIHNSLRKGKYLNRALELQKGDIIVYEDKETRYEYEISELLYVEPTEVSVLEPTEQSMVTIVTCYPADTAEQRYIIRGKLISQASV